MMQRAYITITKTELIKVLNDIGIRKKKEQDIVCERVRSYLNEDLPKIIEREYQLYKLGDNKVLILDREKEIKVSGDSLTEFWDNPEDDRWDKEEEKQDE